MAKKAAPPAPPKEALPQGEANRYLAKFKTSLCNRWSLTSMSTLFEIFELEACLWALERVPEALAVAGAIAAAIPEPPPSPAGGFNYNLWCPATHSHALLAHLGTGRWQARADASRDAILADTGIVRDDPKYLADCVREAKEEAAAPPGEKTIKWECKALAGHLGSMVLYCELAKAGDPLYKKHAKATAAVLPLLLAKLGARLQAGK